jgi:hypothetical protein
MATALYAGTEIVNYKYSTEGKTGYEGCKSECADDNGCLGFEWQPDGENRCAKITNWMEEDNKFRLTPDGDPDPDYSKFKSAVKEN